MSGSAADAAGARPPLALVGYGRMGHTVERLAGEMGHRVTARLDHGDPITAGALAGAEVAIEFTAPEAAVDNVRALARAGVDVVVGTTGWYDRMDEVRDVAREAGVGVLVAPNFSLGVQLFLRAARALARLSDALDEYDVHVHETHHRHKVDHPSGTARRLAEVLLEELGRKREWRSAPSEGAPDPDVLWVGSSRVGEVPGTHVVEIDGPDDRIALLHEARGRDGFARGAVRGARWIRGRSGLHTIEDMLDETFGEPNP